MQQEEELPDDGVGEQMRSKPVVGMRMRSKQSRTSGGYSCPDWKMDVRRKWMRMTASRRSGSDWSSPSS